jgi:threonine synthase
MIFRCISCGTTTENVPVADTRCAKCGDLLDWCGSGNVSVSALLPPPQEFTLWRYATLLPEFEDSRIISLSEGGTPLTYSERLGEQIGIDELFLKNEGRNPTGSFKDRGMTVAVTAASALGYRAAICASTGNTAASMAAYCSKADLKSIVLVPKGKVVGTKLAQAYAAGASILEVEGNFDQALKLVREVQGNRIAILNSINPFRIEGQKTAAFEICDQLGAAPDWLVIPVGNGGNITAYWKGFSEFKAIGAISSLPKMVAVQARGAAPLVHAVRNNEDTVKGMDGPETIASAIRIGKPANWKRALDAVRSSGGEAIAVSDEEISMAREMIARTEGMLVELASAAAVAGLIKLKREGRIGPGENVVCIMTGSGLKDVGEERIRTETISSKASLLDRIEALSVK